MENPPDQNVNVSGGPSSTDRGGASNINQDLNCQPPSEFKSDGPPKPLPERKKIKNVTFSKKVTVKEVIPFDRDVYGNLGPKKPKKRRNRRSRNSRLRRARNLTDQNVNVSGGPSSTDRGGASNINQDLNCQPPSEFKSDGPPKPLPERKKIKNVTFSKEVTVREVIPFDRDVYGNLGPKKPKKRRNRRSRNSRMRRARNLNAQTDNVSGSASHNRGAASNINQDFHHQPRPESQSKSSSVSLQPNYSKNVESETAGRPLPRPIEASGSSTADILSPGRQPQIYYFPMYTPPPPIPMPPARQPNNTMRPVARPTLTQLELAPIDPFTYRFLISQSYFSVQYDVLTHDFERDGSFLHLTLDSVFSHEQQLPTVAMFPQLYFMPEYELWPTDPENRITSNISAFPRHTIRRVPITSASNLTPSEPEKKTWSEVVAKGSRKNTAANKTSKS